MRLHPAWWKTILRGHASSIARSDAGGRDRVHAAAAVALRCLSQGGHPRLLAVTGALPEHRLLGADTLPFVRRFLAKGYVDRVEIAAAARRDHRHA